MNESADSPDAHGVLEPVEQPTLVTGADTDAPVADEPPVPARLERVCIARIGGRLLGIAGRFTREIAPVGALTPIPRLPRFVLGIANLRGVVLPVVDVRAFLGLVAASAPALDSVLVVDVDDVVVGIVVDEVVDFEAIDLDALSNSRSSDGDASPALQAYALGAHRHRHGALTLVDVVRLIGDLQHRIAADAA